MSGVGLFYDARHREHAAEGHVEQPGRLDAVMALLRDAGVESQCVAVAAEPAGLDDLTLVHEEPHVRMVQRMAGAGGGWLDVDTYVARGSWEAARLAVGGCIAAVDAVCGGALDSAFCLVRPHGHHAGRGQAMGFSLFNNVAVAARHAQQRHNLPRVAIVDFDAHHGNGTQEVFYDDPSVLFFSVHQYPYYPGTGHWEESGAGNARGTTMNVPVPSGCGDAAYLLAFERLLAPLIRRFGPHLILVSAGFDAHVLDPLAGMQVTLAGYRRMAEVIQDLADELCGGRVVYALEGGYYLQALAWGVRTCIDVLLGKPFEAGEGRLGSPSREQPDVSALIDQISRAFHLE